MPPEPTMRAIVYRRYGSPDVLSLQDVPIPEVKDGQVRVRVRAVSVNPVDWHLIRGKPYFARLDFGLRRPRRNIPGVDVAGVIESVGSGVTELRPGDEVWGEKGRSLAEYVAGPARLFLPKPDGISFEQAAAIPAAGATALQTLRDKGNLQPGQRVLINGAAGGCGTFGVQIAKALGAHVTGVCSTANLEMVSSLGADEVIDYTREDFTRRADRYDLIIDNAANRSLSAMRRVMTPAGTLVLVGASKGDWIGPVARIAAAALRSRRGTQRMLPHLTDTRREDLEFLGQLVTEGKLTPVIDRRYPLDQAADALRYLETMHARAKVIVTV